ncbi:hypothetical protein [Micromonospora avicenniae]
MAPRLPHGPAVWFGLLGADVEVIEPPELVADLNARTTCWPR